MVSPYKFANDNDITIKKYDFEEFSGICGTFGGKSLIGIKSGYDEVTEREVLSHEIGHFISGTQDNIHFSKWNEKKADICGREFLVPYSELLSAIEDNEGVCDASTLACRFGVSVETMMQRIREAFNLS